MCLHLFARYRKREHHSPQDLQGPYGPFYEADLTGTSFVGARFKNADFRDAKGLEAADFSEAVDLDQCVFDNEKIKADLLARFDL